MSLNFKSNSVIGQGIDADVLTQIQKRTEVLKKTFERTTSDLLFLNSSTGWVKMTSAVDIDSTPDDDKSEYSSTEAKNNILLGGTASSGSGLSAGIFAGSNSSYDLSAVNGYRPMAGITSMDVMYASNFGTLKQATIGIKTNSIEQLSTIEKLFLRPGMTVLLEWGHSYYINNEGEGVSIIKTYEDFFTPIDNEQSGSGKVIVDSIQNLITTSNYNYDAMYGFIKNFSWSYNKDGGYDCKVDIISQGDLIQSLLIDVPTSNTIVKYEPGKSLSESLKRYKTILHIVLDVIKTTGKSSNFDSQVNTNLQAVAGTFYQSLVEEARNVSATMKPIIGSSLNFKRASLVKSENWYGSKEVEGFGYIKIKDFLSILNLAFTLKDKSGNNVVSFNTGKEDVTTPFVTFLQHISINPGIAILPKNQNKFTSQQSEFIYPLMKSFSVPAEGENEILNIFLNVDFILNCYDSVIDTEEVSQASLISFIREILKGLNKTTGGINDFDLHYQEETFTYYVVDRKIVPDENNLNNSKINIIGLGSMLEDLNFSSKLSSNVTTMVAVSAQASSTDVGSSILSLQKWNEGLQDRHLTVRTLTSSDTNSSDGIVKYKAKYDVKGLNLTPYKEFIKDINNQKYPDEIRFTEEDIDALTPLHRVLMEQAAHFAARKNLTNPPGLIPFELSFTMKGISGLKIGQAFKLEDESIIPEAYRNNVAFLITGLNSSIQNNRWVTNIKTQMIVSSVFTEEIKITLEQFLEDIIIDSQNQQFGSLDTTEMKYYPPLGAGQVFRNSAAGGYYAYRDRRGNGADFHYGVDILAEPGVDVFSPIEGYMEKGVVNFSKGLPAVRIRGVGDYQGQRWTFGYIKQTKFGKVLPGEKIGEVLDMKSVYDADAKAKGQPENMVNHVHVDVKSSTSDFKYVDVSQIKYNVNVQYKQSPNLEQD